MGLRVLFVLLILCFSLQCDGDAKLEDVNGVLNASEFNSSRSTFANMIDQALEKEFNETDDKPDVTDHRSFNNSVAEQEVGMSLAQIGEFAFVLLSRASNLHLIEGKVYMLLLGTTALSLVTTPLLFKLIPAVVHLGVLLRWFSPEIPNEIGPKGDILRADSSKRISVLIQGSRDS